MTTSEATHRVTALHRVLVRDYVQRLNSVCAKHVPEAEFPTDNLDDVEVLRWLVIAGETHIKESLRLADRAAVRARRDEEDRR